MKKIYQNPSVTIANVKFHSMVCASLGSLNPQEGSGRVSEDFVESGTAGESRQGSFWEDEE